MSLQVVENGRRVTLESGHQPQFLFGLDANKSSIPGVGDTYYAIDATVFYACFITGVWTVVLNDTSIISPAQIPTFVHLVNHTIPSIQVLGTMDETTYTQIIKTGLSYRIDTTEVSGNMYSAEIATNSAILNDFKSLTIGCDDGQSTHATPIQAEIYGNADSYASPLNTTKFNIYPVDPTIPFIREFIDNNHDYSSYITASSDNQSVWDMTVAGGMPSLPSDDTILATEIGVSYVFLIERSILGDFTDTEILVEGLGVNKDYIVDYTSRIATRIIIYSGSGIVNGQSKIRISWIADVIKVDSTNNTALKVRVYLNRTNTGETSPIIQPIGIGGVKYTAMYYG